MHVLELTVRLVPNPAFTSLAIVGFEDIATAGDHVAFCNRHTPHAMEGMDETLFQHMKEKGKIRTRSTNSFRTAMRGWCCNSAATPSTKRSADSARTDRRHRKAQRQSDRCSSTADQHQMKEIFKIRESGLGVNCEDPESAGVLSGVGRRRGRSRAAGRVPARIPQKTGRVRISRIDIRAFRSGMRALPASTSICSRRRVLQSTGVSSRRWRTSSCKYEGSISGEHGDGQTRAELLPENVRRGIGRSVLRIQDDRGIRTTR